jgi:hypothetical protein
MRDPELEEDCPGPVKSSYEITSPRDPSYNCVAFAVGDTSHFWYDIANVKGYYWPPGSPSADTLAGWIKVFSDHGYKETEGEVLEPEFEKVAIYASTEGEPEHVARQKASGAWVSKMGKGHDIEHTLAALEGAIMGKVVVMMKRKCKDGKRVLE